MKHNEISQFCGIFTDWLEAIKAEYGPVTIPESGTYQVTYATGHDRPHRDERLERIAAVADDLMLAVRKSSYLGRRLYDGEQHRTRRCPKHDGHWAGIPLYDQDCGCDLTGWLPETPPTPPEYMSPRQFVDRQQLPNVSPAEQPVPSEEGEITVGTVPAWTDWETRELRIFALKLEDLQPGLGNLVDRAADELRRLTNGRRIP